MKNPFLNDPFAMVWQAFQNLYPDKNCDVYWDPNLQPDEAGKPVYGVTVFNDDGKVLVFVDAMILAAVLRPVGQRSRQDRKCRVHAGWQHKGTIPRKDRVFRVRRQAVRGRQAERS